MSKPLRKRLRKKLRPLRHRIVYFATQCLIGFLALFSIDRAIYVGEWIGRLAYVFFPRIRNRALKNLELALGNEKSAQELRRIARAMFINIGRSLAEMATLNAWSHEELAQRVDGAAIDVVPSYLEHGGLIVIGAHFGNWELLGVSAAYNRGYPVGVVARDLHNPYMERIINRRREKKGLKILKRGKTGREFFRHLQGKGIMGILLDQDTRVGPGVFVDFFGQPAYTQVGPYQLALRTGASVITMFVVRQPDGRHHKIIIGDEIPLRNEGDPDEQARQFTQAITKSIEDVVRRYPEQWMWIHDRWKRRPLEAPELETGNELQKGDAFTKRKTAAQ